MIAADGLEVGSKLSTCPSNPGSFQCITWRVSTWSAVVPYELSCISHLSFAWLFTVRLSSVSSPSSSQKAARHAGSAPSFAAGANSTPAPSFGAGAFGGAASGPSQTPNPFQPAPAAGGPAAFGQQQPAPTGFGATNTAGVYLRTHLSCTEALCLTQCYHTVATVCLQVCLLVAGLLQSAEHLILLLLQK